MIAEKCAEISLVTNISTDHAIWAQDESSYVVRLCFGFSCVVPMPMLLSPLACLRAYTYGCNYFADEICFTRSEITLLFQTKLECYRAKWHYPTQASVQKLCGLDSITL